MIFLILAKNIMKLNQTIHQIWMQGKENIPDKFQKNISENRRLNPHWKHNIWDATELEKQCALFSKSTLEAFRTCPHMHQKVDLGRYVVLFFYGGISIDMDAKCVRPLDELEPFLEEKADVVLCKNAIHPWVTWFQNTYLNNAHIYCHAPKSRFLEELIQECTIRLLETCTMENVRTHKVIHFTTGPYCLSDVYYSHKDLMHIQVLDSDFFEPCNAITGQCFIEENTFIVHRHELSWFESNEKRFIQMTRLLGSSRFLFWILVILLLIFVLYLFIVISRRYGYAPVSLFVVAQGVHFLTSIWNDRVKSQLRYENPPSDDILFRLIPEPPKRTGAIAHTLFSVGLAILGAILFLWRPYTKHAVRFLWMFAITLLARSITMGLTLVPRLNLQSCMKTPYEKFVNGSCHDKMFSGRVSSLILLSWNLYLATGQKYPFVFVLFVMAGSFVPIWTRHHYTIDVIVSWIWSLLLISMFRK